MNFSVASFMEFWKDIVLVALDTDETTYPIFFTCHMGAFSLVLRTLWNHLERWFHPLCR